MPISEANQIILSAFLPFEGPLLCFAVSLHPTKSQKCQLCMANCSPFAGRRETRGDNSMKNLVILLRISALAILFTALFWAYATLAQSETGTISGLITDETGAAVPNAQVQLLNLPRGTTADVRTNGAGIYVFTGVQPGQYQIRVQKPGFKQVDLLSLIVNVQDHIEQNVRLQVGSVSESVTVNADDLHINTTDATVKTVVDHQLISELPLNGRSFQTLFELTPGVTVAAASALNTGQFSINGQRTSANYFMVDGASANVGVSSAASLGQTFGGSQPALTAAGGTNGLVSVDAVQEFAIQTSSYSAEYGRTPGGQISIVTKSGTNSFHGTAFDYFRNEALDANDWFSNDNGLKRAALRQNDFGGTVGGPLIKNKTFFFFSYEGLRLQLPTAGISTVPGVAARSSAPLAVQPYLKAFPLPTGPDTANGLAPANYSFSNPQHLDSVSLRIDHHLNDALDFFARYNYAPSNAAVRGSSFGLSTISRAPFSVQTLTFGSTYLVTAHVANEMRFNWSKSSAASVFDMDNFGGAVPLNPQTLFPSNVDSSSSLLVFGFLNGKNALLALGPNAKNRQEQINVVDSVSWQHSGHTFKFGVDYRRLLPVHNPPTYDQTALFLGIPSAVGGHADLTGILSATAVHGVASNYSLYVQDTFRVTPRTTITYGVRWDYDPPPTMTGNGGISPAIVTNTNNLSQLALAPAGSSPYHATVDNFAPRIGLAYQMRESPKTQAVVRAGFGIFYDLTDGLVGALASDYPFVAGGAFKFGATPFPLTGPAAAPPVVNNNPPFPAIQGFPDTMKQPYTYHWNLSYEQTLGSSQALTVGYVGSAGHSLVREVTLFSPPLNRAEFQQVNFATNGGYSNYNSLQASFERHAARGLNLLASYTYSHSLDNASSDQGQNAPQGIVSPRADYSSSDFDIRHTGTVGFDYQVSTPHSSRLANSIFGGWGLNTLLTTRTSPPVNVTFQRNLAFGMFAFRPDLVPGQPLYIFGSQCNQAPPLGISAPCPGGKALNPTAFVDPGGMVQGDFGRNALRGFPLAQVDFSLRRTFRITEKWALQARVEAFNLFNHPNFAPPSGFLGTETTPGHISPSPTFGASQSLLNNGLVTASAVGGVGFSPLYQLGGPRSLQLSLKLVF